MTSQFVCLQMNQTGEKLTGTGAMTGTEPVFVKHSS